nr:hypothetical protein [Tanacetum cinerariifolium]
MSMNRRKLKHNIRPPKRFEDFVPIISKRNETEVESCSDDISKDDFMNKEASSSNEVTIGGNDVTRDFVVSVEESNGRNRDMSNEKGNNVEQMNNSADLVSQERISLSDTELSKTVRGDKNDVNNKSYANMVKTNEMLVNKKLMFIAPKVTKDGMVKVLFNEEIGISALASSLGKPLILDAMTTNMCQYGVGMIDFARVLVEIKANTKLGDKIEIEYIGKNESDKGTKEIKVMYDWKPDACPHCCVFGHS